MNNIFGMLVLIVVGGAGLIALLTTFILLLPAPVERTRAALEASLGRSLLLGAVNFLFVGVLDALFLWLAQLAGGGVPTGILALLAGALTLGLALLALLGLASLVNLLGSRMGKTKTEVYAHLRGGLLFVLAGLTPYIGWFVFMPLALWAGLGAAIQTIFRRRSTPGRA